MLNCENDEAEDTLNKAQKIFKSPWSGSYQNNTEEMSLEEKTANAITKCALFYNSQDNISCVVYHPNEEIEQKPIPVPIPVPVPDENE
jgi:serine/threonine protein phosphatase PrpC